MTTSRLLRRSVSILGRLVKEPLRIPGHFKQAAMVARQQGLRAMIHRTLVAGSNSTAHLGDYPGEAVDRKGLRQRALSHALELLPIEPELLTAVRLLESEAIPVVGAIRNDPTGVAWRALFPRLRPTYKRIILVPWITHGGADLVALYAAKLAMEEHAPQETLMIVADTGNLVAKDWLPRELNLIVLSEFAPSLSVDERVELLLCVLRTLKPVSVLNVNSRVGWELYEQYGRPLASFTQLFATLFCPDYDEQGRLDGYASRYFRSTLPQLSAIYFDNASFIEQLWSQYAPPHHLRARLRTIYQPAPLVEMHSSTELRGASPFRVLWAGRLCAQKNLNLLIEIARSAPTIEFEVYGRGDDRHTSLISKADHELSNLKFCGSYSSFEELPLSTYNAYLYTSLWDGLPNALLTAAGTGMPVVASAVGGISELVNNDTGWLVEAPMQAAGYVRALDEIRAGPELARQRTRKMRELIFNRHSWGAYVMSMKLAPAFA